MSEKRLEDSMSDLKKFYVLIFLSILLVIFIIINNLLEERLSRDLLSYLERRYYYERVISKKGLSLERARYWREEK
jgi:hypothetical protein